MRRFCYRCGASETEGSPLIQGLCQACFTKENPLVRAPAEIRVSICSKCKAHFVDNRWREPKNAGSALEEAARAAVLSELRFVQFTPAGTRLLGPREIEELELHVEPKLTAREVTVDVNARGKVHQLQARPHDEHVRILVKPMWRMCDVCSLVSAGYHEAIVQVRGMDMSAEARREIKFMLERCATGARKQNRAAFIAKIEEKKGGLDLYVNPAGLARQMASLLKDKFGAEVSETAKLMGMGRGGKRKFKISMLVRLQDRGLRRS